jgi:hypothetical protein
MNEHSAVPDVGARRLHELRKVGDEWFVVDLELVFLS